MKKKVILTDKQFTKICEGYDETSATKLNYIANDEKDITNVGVDAFNKISDNGGKNIQLTVNTPNATPNDNVNITGIGNTPQEQLNNAIEQANNSGINHNDVNFNLNIDNNGELVKTNENKKYSKKQIEEARVKNIKENKIIYSKQQLQEAFLGDMSAQQVKNITGIEDDDELNLSIKCEEREELMHNICRDICATDNAVSIYKGVFNFKTIIEIMKKYGFYYMGPYEEDESYNFSDGENEITIWPSIFYPQPGAIHIDNMDIMKVGMNESKNIKYKHLNETKSKSYIKRKIISHLYKGLSPLTGKMYSDTNWEGVSNIYITLNEMIGNSGEVEMRVENGGYWKSMGEFPNYKEYLITITLNEGIIINGSLKCHAAGTIEDTFKYYDITVTLW